ncbi:hypothetical protein HYALB_00004132 [Hymenoscyphus albidus]|uniref:Uncharacterized protein n=1 Tax=Hymenoscyphus albidus TaxID=595503 RepID=A0A9N9LN01_9HELO|nr:hypothetical protein HYALB_00004132 [Hymenoscyphus albidus]
MRAVQAILFFSAAVGVMAGCQKGTESCSHSNVRAAEGGFHNSWKCDEADEKPCNAECMVTGAVAAGPNPGFDNDLNQMLTTMCCKYKILLGEILGAYQVQPRQSPPLRLAMAMV